MSEKSIMRQQWGSSEGTRVQSESRNLAQGPTLAANSLCRRAEEVYRALAGGPNRKFRITVFWRIAVETGI